MHDYIRLTELVLIAPLAPIGLYHRLKAAQTKEAIDRRKEGWALLLGIRLVAFITLIQTYRGLSNSSDVAFLPEAVRLVGVGITAIAVAWLIWMFVSLGMNITDTVVTRKQSYFVDWGPYRYVRNPMYTGLLSLGIGLGLALQDWTIFAGFTGVFILLALRTKREETYLIARFGDQYRDYMSRVGRFFPAF